ncbi:MAG: PEP/pyruvate-binding domain-containing protein [Steroidobacteraceae bacterium]
MPHVLAFDRPEALSQPLTGGKGANLSSLTQAGFAVPPGFCVTTNAYAAFMDHGDLKKRIAALAGEFSYGDLATLERQAAAIRNIILQTHIPAGLAAEIEQAYAGLGAGVFVAVRSSGTAEDLVGASFAGQHDTYLNIRGGIDVVEAVRQCWASLWTARAAIYRRDRAFDDVEIQMAVVVQKMVQSEVSGVLFTANPMTNATDEMVINATWGLGEALVQGVVTPDQYTVHRPSCTLIQQTLGEKELRIVRNRIGGGVATENVPVAERARFCLDLPTIVALAQLGDRAQQHHGGVPQDIEWGIEGSTLYLLQARPITGAKFSQPRGDAIHPRNSFDTNCALPSTVVRGTATSPGIATGVARIVMDRREISRVQQGEILVTHSTDPGWNPVFGIISAVVIETGGLLSHASCLAREYGFPAVHLPDAAKLIQDGARITVDGHTGTITVVDVAARIDWATTEERG